MSTALFVPYADLRLRLRSHWLYKAELPMGSAVSIPLPTRRFGTLAYVAFASPAQRRPNQPTRQSPPERWWLVDAHTGTLLSYSLCKIFSFADTSRWSVVELPPSRQSMEEYEAQAVEFDSLLDQTAADFFNGAPGDTVKRNQLSALLGTLLPAPLLPQYQAAAPDFFAWLQAK